MFCFFLFFELKKWKIKTLVFFNIISMEEIKNEKIINNNNTENTEEL